MFTSCKCQFLKTKGIRFCEFTIAGANKYIISCLGSCRNTYTSQTSQVSKVLLGHYANTIMCNPTFFFGVTHKIFAVTGKRHLEMDDFQKSSTFGKFAHASAWTSFLLYHKLVRGIERSAPPCNSPLHNKIAFELYIPNSSSNHPQERGSPSLSLQNIDNLAFVWIILTSLFNACRSYRDRQKPANGTQCPTLTTDS